MKIILCEQGSQEWFESRLGVPSASNFDKIITMDGKPSKQREKYLYQLAGEKVCKVKTETFQSAAMAKGVETESEARSFYEFTYDCEVAQVGFCLSDCERWGCSPDGLVGDGGLLELKCPLIQTHVGYLVNGGLDTDYFHQTQGQLFVTGRKWCDIMSYYPGIKPLIIRVLPDLDFHKKLEAELIKFNSELTEVVKKIGG